MSQNHTGMYVCRKCNQHYPMESVHICPMGAMAALPAAMPPAIEYKDWEPGDVDGPNDMGVWTAGIHEGNEWGNRIEVYGDTKEHATDLRDTILNLLNLLKPVEEDV